MIPQSISLLVLSLDVSEGQHSGTISTGSPTGISYKRQRTTKLSGGHFDDLLRDTKSPHVGTRICALQTMVFALEEKHLTEDRLKTIMSQLVACVSDDNNAIASWALIAIARLCDPFSIILQLFPVGIQLAA